MLAIISILLFLILVAMVSSNKDSAQGVKNILKYCLLFFVTVVFFASYITLSYWITDTFFKDRFAEHIILGFQIEENLYLILDFLYRFIIPVLIVYFIGHKEILESFKVNQIKFNKYVLYICFRLFGVMVFWVVYLFLDATFEHVGWFILISLFVGCVLVLFMRSVSQNKSWKDVVDPPSVYELIEREKNKFNEKETSLEVNFKMVYAQLTDQEISSWYKDQYLREQEHRLNLRSIEKKSEANETKSRSVIDLYNITTVFIVIGVSLEIWNYIKNWTFIKLIFHTIMFILGLVIFVALIAYFIYERYKKFTSLKNQDLKPKNISEIE